MKKMALVALLVALGLGRSGYTAEQPDTRKVWPPADAAKGEWLFEKRWVYCSFNNLVDKNTDKLLEIMKRAGAAGYNGIVLADYKFNILESMPDRYFRNLDRVKAKAKELGLELIPTCFPIGYSSGLLSHDQNLAAGLPVKDALFVVKGGIARPKGDPEQPLKNGDFENVNGDKCTGFSFQDGAGTYSFSDTETVKSGKRSLRYEEIGKHNQHGHGRISQTVKVRKFRYYKLSVWIKTEKFENPKGVKMLALAGKQSLSQMDLKVARTQDWKRHQVVFNTLENEEVRVYVGAWGGRGGKMWLDDWRMEEAGLLNVLRREGAPFVVKGEDGTVYEEGKDFEPVADPKLGKIPWPGQYKLTHEPPEGIKLTEGSAIKEGARLRVSYSHPVIIYWGQVCCCPSEPKVYEILTDQAERLVKIFGGESMFMSHDEIRCMGWDESCRKRGLTAGEILADNVRRCAAILEKARPGVRKYVWSDMFDPNHNARKNFYLVNGDLAGSWEGLKKDIVIVNWHSKTEAGLKHFESRGHSQVIAGFYDADPRKNLSAWYSKASGVKGVIGCMYTTWRSDFTKLEEFARLMKRGELVK